MPFVAGFCDDSKKDLTKTLAEKGPEENAHEPSDELERIELAKKKLASLIGSFSELGKDTGPSITQKLAKPVQRTTAVIKPQELEEINL